MKKLIKALMLSVVAVIGAFIAGIVFLDTHEEWLYEKFGKDEVRGFMKRFEPFITMDPDEDDETEEAEETEETEEADEIEASEDILDNVIDITEE